MDLRSKRAFLAAGSLSEEILEKMEGGTAPFQACLVSFFSFFSEEVGGGGGGGEGGGLGVATGGVAPSGERCSSFLTTS